MTAPSTDAQRAALERLAERVAALPDDHVPETTRSIVAHGLGDQRTVEVYLTRLRSPRLANDTYRLTSPTHLNDPPHDQAVAEMAVLDDLSGVEFEDLMEDVFRNLGYENVR